MHRSWRTCFAAVTGSCRASMGCCTSTKPPLAYWGGALALRLLGHSELALRVPATLAWLLSAWLVFRLGLAATLDRRRATWAAVFASFAPLAVVQARMLSSDVFLWPATLCVYLGVVDVSRSAWGRAALTGVGLAAGLLAKGHLVLFWTISALLVWAGWQRRWRAAGVLGHPHALVLGLGAGLPCYVIEALRHPQLVRFWLGRETAGRYLSGVHGRHEPWWYFAAILPAMVLPWLPEIVRGAARALRREATEAAAQARLWVLWAGLPLVLFSVSGSKRSNYLIPLLAPLALLAASALPAQASRHLGIRTGVWSLVVLLSPFVLGAVPGLAPATRELATAARRTGGQLVAYHELPTSLPFYYGANVAAVFTAVDETLDDAQTCARWRPPRPDAVAPVLAHGGLVLARTEDWPVLSKLAGVTLTPVASGGGRVLLHAPGAARP
jgi:4-amino-4-deoxy-L-arabinose transferase-like glycosyltransferase